MLLLAIPLVLAQLVGGLSFHAPTPVPTYTTTVNVTDGQSIQTALTTVAATGGAVFVAAGSYPQTQSLIMSSNTALLCSRGASITATSVGWTGNKWLVTNTNVAATALTDKNIKIDGCAFSLGGTFTTDGTFHNIHMRMVSDVTVTNNSFVGGGDGTAMLASLRTSVRYNTMATAFNACWDHWEAPAAVSVRGNTCTSALYGILVTGTDTAHATAGVANGGDVTNNIINLASGSLAAGVWLNGLGTAGSGASNVIVSTNRITGNGTTNFSCLKVTGASQNNIFAQNYCGTSGTDSVGGSSTPGGDGGGTPTATNYTNNNFDHIQTQAGNVAVVILKGTSDVAYTNTVSGGQYPSPFWLSGVNDAAHCNVITSGTGTDYNTSGATNPVVSCP